MSTNKTPNLKLHSWEPTDPVKRVEFNDNWDAIDKRFGEITGSFAQVETLLNSHTASIAKLGNCQIETRSYTGTGTYGADNPTRITFSKKPTAFMIVGDGLAVCVGDNFRRISQNGGTAPNDISWSGSTVSFYYLGGDWAQFNTPGERYSVIALISNG